MLSGEDVAKPARGASEWIKFKSLSLRGTSILQVLERGEESCTGRTLKHDDRSHIKMIAEASVYSPLLDVALQRFVT